MADSGSDPLKRAHALIKSGDKKSATKLLKQVLQNDKDNAGAWWLLANAVDNPTHQEKALEQVLRLRPGEKKAQQMLTRLKIGGTVASDDLLGRDEFSIAPLERAPSRPARDENPFEDDPFADDPFKDDPFTDDPFAETDPFASPRQSRAYSHSNDPFGGQNPFGDESAFPSSHLHQQSTTLRPAYPAKPQSGRNTTMILVGLAAFVVIMAGAGIVAFMSVAGGSMSVSGNCDLGSSVHQSLTTVDCFNVTTGSRWTGRLNGLEQHDWRLVANANQQVQISVSTRADNNTDVDWVDTVLEIISPENVLIASHDDIDVADGNLNSRLTLTIPETGVYIIRVRDYIDDGGEYDLRVTAVGGSGSSQASSSSTNCDVGVMDRPFSDQPVRVTCASVERGSRVQGRVNANEEHAWTFQGRGGESYTINLIGTDDGDMYLELYNQRGNLIAENDDISLADGNLNSRISVTLTGSEQYTIVVRTFSEFTAARYELRLEG